MDYFLYKDGELHCEEVPLSRIAGEVGTPVYVYSRRTLARHYRALDDAFAGFPHVTCYSVKANSSLAVLRLLSRLGAGADIVSGGELFRSLRAGIDPRRIVFSGVGKTEEEIAFALRAGILMFNCEGEEEFRRIDQVAGRLGMRAPVSIRVNPDIDPGTHKYIATGMIRYKFGISIVRAVEKFQTAASLPNLDVIGVSCHIGSQILEVRPFADALDRMLGLVDKLAAAGIRVRHLDMGGGLGIQYNDERPPAPDDFARAFIERLVGRDLTLVLEPGRAIVGNAGVLLTRVLYRKQRDQKTFVVVDAGMNDLIRPSLYGSYHALRPVRETDDRRVVADVVGPICESGDFLALDREVPLLSQGELFAVMSAGAYGFSMASNYNTRPRPAEVLVDGDRFAVVRRRETMDDLVAGESIPDWLEEERAG